MLERDFPTVRGMSSDIFAISEAMVIQGLTYLSDELPKVIVTLCLPKYENTLGFITTRC